VPAAIPNLIKAGLEVVVEAGAGAAAGYPDADYTAKGAKITADRAEVFRAADIWCKFSVMDPTTRPARPTFPFSAMARHLLDFEAAWLHRNHSGNRSKGVTSFR